MFGKRSRRGRGESDTPQAPVPSAEPPAAPQVMRPPGYVGGLGELARILATAQTARAAGRGEPDAVAAALRRSFGTEDAFAEASERR
jgi:hypothetical protein